MLDVTMPHVLDDVIFHLALWHDIYMYVWTNMHSMFQCVLLSTFCSTYVSIIMGQSGFGDKVSQDNNKIQLCMCN